MTTVANRVPELNCQECGACCCLFTVQLSDGDELNISNELVEPWPNHKGEFVMRGTGGDVDMDNKQTGNGCAAFVGKVGAACSCAIYKSGRPWVCRNFEPGGVLCHQARRFHGLE